jgi:predicted unusual protein kinase regulating ubiquinone biosynthesis (AarF/ABC1/UbiB family)
MVLFFSVILAVTLLFCQENLCNGILQHFRFYSSNYVETPIRVQKLSILQRFNNAYKRTFQRVSGNRKVLRDVSFWMRSLQIYSSYKFAQAKNKVKNKILRKNQSISNQTWTTIHERNSRRMINLCLSLRGFYLKTGQFLGTRHDFMPSLYTTKLSKLHDDVPPLSGREIRKIIEKELNGTIEEYFTSITLEKPIGCASIAQVHDGIWKKTGTVIYI